MNIYVGNISRSATDAELRSLFAEFGGVDKASVIRDKFTGVSRGFGFVEMPVREEAEKAISAMNGRNWMGRTLTVNEARPRAERPRDDRSRTFNRNGFGEQPAAARGFDFEPELNHGRGSDRRRDRERDLARDRNRIRQRENGNY